MAGSKDKEERFKVGDIVQLKSGGPKMTVEEELGSGDIRCQWFAGSKLSWGDFPAHSLARVEEEQK